MRTLSIALLALYAVALSAQGQPQFRSSTRLVQVSVAVEGRDGKPITGLTAKDFRVFDDGQEQRIELFLVDTAKSNPRDAAAATAPPATASGAQTFSNRLSGTDSASVILFDRLNTTGHDQLYARDSLIKFLAQIRGDDRVGIYILEGNGIRVLHDFTNDARSLLRAMSRYRAMTSNELADASLPELGETGDAAVDAELSRLLDRANTNMAAHFSGLRADVTLEAFLAIANRLAAIEGRKNLIWITAGLPLQAFRERGMNGTEAVQKLTRPLSDANVTLYPVDARGLIGAMTLNKGIATITTLASVQVPLELLRASADETGGRTFFNTNDLNGAVRRAVDDSRGTYVLGYYPSHGKWNGAYRPIKVQLNRPNVQIRHRKGYRAVAPAQRVETDASIRSALLSPLEATGLELSARMERAGGEANNIALAITTAPGAVAFERVGDYWEGVLDVVVAQTLADGKAIRSVNQRVNLSLRPDRYEEARTQGFKIDLQVTLVPGVQNLHIVVHDASAGNTGSIVIPATKLR